MKTLKLITLSIFMLGAQAVDVGLKGGNELSVTRLTGEISVTCFDRGQSRYARYRCRESLLQGGTHQKFINKSGVDANKVKLTYRDYRGKKKSKSSSFDAKKGESKKHFNLWIATLLQRPMLNLGENVIKYTMYKDKEAVESSEFSVNVYQGESRSCRYAHYSSSSMNDCTNGDYICSRYFRDFNYCR